MDDQSRMMHYQQAYGMGGMGDQASPGAHEDNLDSSRGHADINTILDQIMNITDQSLDEAQVSFLLFFPWSNIPPPPPSVLTLFFFF